MAHPIRPKGSPGRKKADKRRRYLSDVDEPVSKKTQARRDAIWGAHKHRSDSTYLSIDSKDGKTKAKYKEKSTPVSTPSGRKGLTYQNAAARKKTIAAKKAKAKKGK